MGSGASVVFGMQVAIETALLYFTFANITYHFGNFSDRLLRFLLCCGFISAQGCPPVALEIVYFVCVVLLACVH